MALPQNFVTLGELADTPFDDEEDADIQQNIVELVEKSYPEGWRDWKAVDLSKEEIIGKKPDPAVLNRLRFALPTADLVKAIDPDAQNISEKAFRNLKLSLLEWPLTRALIIFPVSIGTRIRGSAAQYEIFSNAVEQVKEKIVSKDAVNKILIGETIPVDTRKRRSTSAESESLPKIRRLDATEKTVADLSKRTQNIENLLHQILENQSQRSETEIGYETSEDEEEPRFAEEPEAEDVTLPGFLRDEDYDKINFLPEVKEAEPTVPNAEAETIKLGLACQRLGTFGIGFGPNWNRVRFTEAQKKLQATPLFTSLKINDQLKPKAAKWCSSETWVKFDNALALISHG